jgi:cob(I)alamin adenosyltransferase
MTEPTKTTRTKPAVAGPAQPAQPEPAIGYQIVAALNDRTQMTFSHFVGQNDSDKKVNATIDRIMGFMQRQRAKFDVAQLTDELTKMTTTLENLGSDVARVDEQFDRDKRSTIAEIEQLADQIEAVERPVRNGDVVSIRGAAKAQVEHKRTRIRNLQEHIQKKDAEREEHRATLLVNVSKFKASIEETRARLAAAKALIGE